MREAAAGRALLNKSFNERRAAIFAIYNRKVAEQGQLFPIFHTFETAFRSQIAVALEAHYDRIDWWAPVYARMMDGDADAVGITFIGRQQVGRNTVGELTKLVRSIEGERLNRNVLPNIENGYKLLDHLEMSWIGRLVTDHWSVFEPSFRSLPHKMTRGDFGSKFAKIRDARNDIYHHKPTARTKAVVSAAEELLDRIGICLRFHFDRISEAQLSSPPFAVEINARHNSWII